MNFTHFVAPYRWIGLEQLQFDVLKNTGWRTKNRPAIS